MSNEHLNNDSSPSQNNEWEAAALSFVEGTSSKQPSGKSAKKKRVNRRTLSVILSSAGTILLACVVLVIMLTDGFQAEQNSGDDDTTQSTDSIVEDTTPSITLLDKTGNADTGVKASQLSRIDITNTDDTFTIRYDSEAKGYVINGYEDIDLSSSLLTTLRNYTETIQATDLVENVTNLAAFGLDEPQATATITYEDQSTATIRVGSETPSKSGYYGQLEGDENVYIFDKNALTLFRSASVAFVDTQLISTPSVKTDDANGTALLKDVTFGGTAFPTTLSLRRSNHNDSEEMGYFAYLITVPYFRAARDSVSNALGQFKSLSADQALFIHPTAEQKKKLGFDKPLMTVQATMAVETEEDTESDEETAEKIYYNSAKYNLTVGSTDQDGNYIVMIDGIDAIFLISKSSYGYLFELTYENTVNEFLFIKNIDSISRITIRHNGQDHDFNLTHYPNKEESDDQLVVTMGDAVYSTANFRNLYSLMLKLERHEQADSKPDSDVPLEITLYDLEGNLYLSAKYYNASGSVCVVETSEGELFTTRWSYVSFFIQQVDNYLNGKDVLSNT